MISKHILQMTFLNEHELILFHTVKWFQLFLFKIRIILFTVNHLFAHSLMFSSIAMYCIIQSNIIHSFTHS